MTNQKYLKYKLKYLNLKKKLLGGDKSKKQPRGCNKTDTFCVDFKDKCRTSTKGTKSNNCECKASGNCISTNKTFSQNLKKLYDILDKLQVNLINTHNNLEDLDKLQIKDYNIDDILDSFKTFQEGINVIHQSLINTPIEFKKSTEKKHEEVVEEKVEEEPIPDDTKLEAETKIQKTKKKLRKKNIIETDPILDDETETEAEPEPESKQEAEPEPEPESKQEAEPESEPKQESETKVQKTKKKLRKKNIVETDPILEDHMETEAEPKIAEKKSAKRKKKLYNRQKVTEEIGEVDE